MRVLVQKDKLEYVMMKVKSVEYETAFGHGEIRIYTSHAIIFVITTVDELEGIQIAFLRDGYYDFRGFVTHINDYKEWWLLIKTVGELIKELEKFPENWYKRFIRKRMGMS